MAIMFWKKCKQRCDSLWNGRVSHVFDV